MYKNWKYYTWRKWKWFNTSLHIGDLTAEEQIGALRYWKMVENGIFNERIRVKTVKLAKYAFGCISFALTAGCWRLIGWIRHLIHLNADLNYYILRNIIFRPVFGPNRAFRASI